MCKLKGRNLFFRRMGGPTENQGHDPGNDRHDPQDLKPAADISQHADSAAPDANGAIPDSPVPDPKPSETGMHGTVQVEERQSATTFPLARIPKIAAISALSAAVAAGVVNQIRIRHDSDIPESAGNGEDVCGPTSFAVDAKPEDMAKPWEDKCRIVTDPDGTIHIFGHTLINADGNPIDCFVQPVWSPDAAMKIRGEISGRRERPGKITLERGKLCVMMLHENEPEVAESLVIGEASLRITTTGKVLVKMIDPEPYKGTDEVLRYVMVAPVVGEVLIEQDGRDGQIHLNEGDQPVKIPIDRLKQDGGCYIARPGNVGVEGDGESGGDGGGIILTASAIFLALRRRRV